MYHAKVEVLLFTICCVLHSRSSMFEIPSTRRDVVYYSSCPCYSHGNHTSPKSCIVQMVDYIYFHYRYVTNTLVGERKWVGLGLYRGHLNGERVRCWEQERWKIRLEKIVLIVCFNMSGGEVISMKHYFAMNECYSSQVFTSTLFPSVHEHRIPHNQNFHMNQVQRTPSHLYLQIDAYSPSVISSHPLVGWRTTFPSASTKILTLSSR